MPCIHVKTKDKLIAICCTARERARRCKCGEPSKYQCDWKTGPGKTCDRYICAKCAKEVAPEKHLCAAHQVAYSQWLAARVRPTNHGSSDA